MVEAKRSRSIWALIRRYAIVLSSGYIRSAIRIFIWPTLCLGFLIYSLTEFVGSEHDNYINKSKNSAWIVITVVFTTIFHLTHFAQWLVTDRATGFKSLMLCMGLKRTSYYLANSICMLATVLPLALIICGLSLGYILTDSKAPAVLIILVFVLFSIHWTGNAFVLASIIASRKYIDLVYALVFLQLSLYNFILYLMPKISEPLQPVLLFFASMSPYGSISLFFSSYAVCRNCDMTAFTNGHAAQPTYLILVATTLWSIASFAFARWVEKMIDESSSKYLSLNCCKLSSSYHDKNNSFSGDPEEDTSGNSRYFERTMAHQEIGISVRNLTKTFNDVSVVNNITFNVYRGETTLLLGPNGAGKTTLMDMVLGKITPSQGLVMLGDSGSEMQQNVGVCPQTSILDEHLTVQQHLELFLDLKASHMSGIERANHIRATMADTSLTNDMQKLPNELSGGMKRKLSLAMAFVGDSSILILDEPSSGLDPEPRMLVWNAIRRYRSDRTVLLSTQHMEEADYLGDRIAIMKEGHIICCGSSTFLNKIYGSGYKLRVECLASKKDQVLTYVRKYFATAKLSEIIQVVTRVSSRMKKDPMEDFVIEMNDERSKDAELSLIQMLEEIESNSKALHIKSHSLRSSSMEDVIVNASNIAQNPQDSKRSSSATTSSDNIRLLTEPSRLQGLTFLASQRSLLYALLQKHMNVYKRVWLSILIYRVLVPVMTIWLIVFNLDETLSSRAGYRPSFYPSLLVFHYIYNPVLERSTKFKTMQMTSGANPVVYWLAHLLSDSLSFIVIIMGFNLLLAMTFTGVYLESKLTIHCILTIAALLMAIAMALVAYLLSFILTDVQTCFYYFQIINLTSVIFSLKIEISEEVFGSELDWMWTILESVATTISPLDSFQYILYGLGVKCYIWPDTHRNCISISSFSPIIYGFTALAGQVLIYGCLLYFIEKQNVDVTWYLNWKNILGAKRKSFTGEMYEINADVMSESSKAAELMVSSQGRESYKMIASDISKSYIKGHRVVDLLSMTVELGECFGLLGVCGAGKSTTFAMIVDELKPDSGRIWVNGYFNNDGQARYGGHCIGYDPQYDPHLVLSPIEALSLVARLRHVDEQKIPKEINAILELLSMTKHATKTALVLSGGAKRKLSLAMSLIGGPALLVLDEPTAGVDPIARRSIWQLLRSLRAHNGTSVIISSQAMEECEAICDRISIMARGRLRCIGSFLSLRTKFSQGCSVRVQFSSHTKQVTKEEARKLIRIISERLQKELGASVKLTDTNANSATYNISDNSVRRSKIFKLLRELGQKYPQVSYRVNDSSLEDVFIALAREQQAMEERQ